MPETVIADTSALVALLNRRDQHHHWAMERFRELPPPLLTCQAVMAESFFMLQDMPRSRRALMDLWHREILSTDFSADNDRTALLVLIKRYQNIPMSFADACLVRMSENQPRSRIWTLDSDFRIYRRNGRQIIPLLAP